MEGAPLRETPALVVTLPPPGNGDDCAYRKNRPPRGSRSRFTQKINRAALKSLRTAEAGPHVRKQLQPCPTASWRGPT